MVCELQAEGWLSFEGARRYRSRPVFADTSSCEFYLQVVLAKGRIMLPVVLQRVENIGGWLCPYGLRKARALCQIDVLRHSLILDERVEELASPARPNGVRPSYGGKPAICRANDAGLGCMISLCRCDGVVSILPAGEHRPKLVSAKAEISRLRRVVPRANCDNENHAGNKEMAHLREPSFGEYGEKY